MYLRACCFDVPAELISCCSDVSCNHLFWRSRRCSDVPGHLFFWHILSAVVLKYLVSCFVVLYLASCCSEEPCQMSFLRTWSAFVLTYLVSCFFLKYFTCQILFWLSPVSCGSEVPGQLLFCDWSAVVLTYIDTHPCFDVPGLLLFWRNLQIDGSAEAVGKLIVLLPVNIVPKSWREHLVLSAEKTKVKKKNLQLEVILQIFFWIFLKPSTLHAWFLSNLENGKS